MLSKKPKSPRKKTLAAFSQISYKELKRQKSEKQIQDEIVEVLKYNQIVHTISDASRVFGPDGRPRRSKVDKDWPDITCITKLPASMVFVDEVRHWRFNQCVLIETKSAKGRLSPGQINLHAVISFEQHTPILVPHSVEEFIRLWEELTATILEVPGQPVPSGGQLKRSPRVD